MLRPATLLRVFVAPTRPALPKAASPSITLAARNYSTPSESSSPAPTPTPTASTPPPPVSSPESTPASPLPYTVGRTPSNHLAVYNLAKRGGNKKLTAIKKVEGDRARFRAALAEALGVEEKGVMFNSLTGHFTVKGHQKEAITGWLEKQGF